MRKLLLVICIAAICVPAFAADEYTLYELLAPETHSFVITYDYTVTREGEKYFFNPIRAGSTASKESVIDRATGLPLKFGTVTGKEAKAMNEVSPRTNDTDEFLMVTLANPVPPGGQARVRIFKTYTDAPSYYVNGDVLTFDRPLGVKRNTVILPAGWELLSSASPAIVSTDPDGRIRLSFLNDRDDQLPVKITARRLP